MLSPQSSQDRAWTSNLLAIWEEVCTHPGVGRHQGVRSERWGTVRWERVGFGDEGVVPLVVHSRMYKPAIHSPGAVPYGNKTQVSKVTKSPRYCMRVAARCMGRSTY